MLFLGPPGTGKTTVAKLFAGALAEEGLLERGHLITATVGDLVGQYVGETRIKTAAVCERALGGVLFVDEAYGLYNPTTEHNYEKEAQEVLLQYMENHSDLIVIFAGYKDQIMELLEKGNPGLKSRFNIDLSSFEFQEYTPEALFEIALRNLRGYELTESFKTALKRVITYQYQHRDDKWGNVREAENLVGAIMAEYSSRGDSGPVTEDYIPEEKRRQVDNSTLKMDSVQDLLGELNKMIGLQEVKTTIEDIIFKAIASRRLMEIRGTSEMSMVDLNFVFSGPPGTGKTSVARLLGRILKSAGILPSSEVIECGKQDIIRPEVGGTSKRVEDLFKQSIGKVLFIDEAYSLMDSMDAINTFVHCMTKQEYKGKLSIILAGYPLEMKALLDRNRGMSRRFGYFLNFENYSNDELWEIFKLKVAATHMLMDEDSCKGRAIKWFSGLVRDRNFENAGCCDKLLELVMSRWGRRTALLSAPTRAEMETLIAEDFPS
jgi:replication-associated recombination protein RarA